MSTCNEFYEAIKNVKSQDNRVLSENFMRAPSRRTDPEYYKIIETPIDFARIQQKLKNEEYESFNDFYDDMELVINNAKKFFQASHPS